MTVRLQAKRAFGFSRNGCSLSPKYTDNLNPVGRVYSGTSVLLCSPHAIAESGTALGTQATEQTLRGVAESSGLSRFRKATETPFNRVFEARR